MKRMIIMLLVFIPCVSEAASRRRAPAKPRWYEKMQDNDVKYIANMLNNDPDALKNRTDVNQRTLLMKAVEFDSPDIAELLIMRGIDIDAQDKEGNTALMLAVKEMRPRLVKLLLQYKADTSIVNHIKWDVFSILRDEALDVGKNNKKLMEINKLLEAAKGSK